MNKLILTGRPTRDPQIIYTGEGEKQKMTAKLTLAVNRIFKRENEPTADFIPCVVFGRQAKVVEQYVRKGMLVLITGRLTNNDYINREGVKVYSFQMVVDTVELLESKNSNDAPAPEPMTDEDGYMQITEEEMAEMPFK